MPCLRHFLSALLVAALPQALAAAGAPIAIAIHGGAGTIDPAQLSPQRRAAIEADLGAALDAGHAVLAAGGSSLDAVTVAVVMLEDSPHFNAGRGAVFNAEGRNDLDAAVMTGHDRRAGAVAGLTRTRNPVLAARAVMEHSPHVFMIGAGAEAFARARGLERAGPAWFRTEARWQQYLDAREREGERRRASGRQAAVSGRAADYYGTVGAVALDRNGHVAAATSTGGMTLKRFGRVGDVPVLGAGTWAEHACAVSATGWGEMFIRAGAGHEICARVRLAGQSLAEAARSVVAEDIPALGGDGGVIAVDGTGNIAMPYSSAGMYRGRIDADGRRMVAIWAEDDGTPQ
ncbi:MAG: isoaspartyl peptidase/L-asparaginase [Xanthomonadales bacterium]|nr:isoaspartyl peptidase/L-asparaginase [Xanthomonadales bacterium]